MITDKETNFVYFSEKIQNPEYNPAFQRIKAILDKHDVIYGFLNGTNDIWCRDYMPIQITKNKFVQFQYKPSYLQKELNLQSDPKEVLRANELNINPIYSEINLDGGNVVKGENSVIITDRIFTENDKIDRQELLRDIEKLMETKVILIPNIKYDMTGHADGHVRYITDELILVNALADEQKNWQKGFQEMIKKSGLNYMEMPWFFHKDIKHPNTAIGVYVNYLEIGNLIVFPIFDAPGNKNDEALKVIGEAFPTHKIEPVLMNEIANDGGMMNCITWSINV